MHSHSSPRITSVFWFSRSSSLCSSFFSWNLPVQQFECTERIVCECVWMCDSVYWRKAKKEVTIKCGFPFKSSNSHKPHSSASTKNIRNLCYSTESIRCNALAKPPWQPLLLMMLMLLAPPPTSLLPSSSSLPYIDRMHCNCALSFLLAFNQFSKMILKCYCTLHRTYRKWLKRIKRENCQPANRPTDRMGDESNSIC